MQKQTLKFSSFEELSSFVKPLSVGYLINTTALTITARLPNEMIMQAEKYYQARRIETTEKVYSYNA